MEAGKMIGSSTAMIGSSTTSRKASTEDISSRENVKRRLQLLRNFATRGRLISDGPSQITRGKVLKMRWSPFNVFDRKTVNIKEIIIPLSNFKDDTTENQETCTSTGSEVFDEVEYRWGTLGVTASTHPNKLTDENSNKGLNMNNNDEKKSSSPYLFRILERRESAGTSIADIRIAHKDGVDNTGSFHWPTEDILTKYILSKNNTNDESVAFLELGAGCGVASFALVLAAADGYLTAPLTSSNLTIPTVPTRVNKRVFILSTDGNSRVVDCINMNMMYEGLGVLASSQIINMPFSECTSTLYNNVKVVKILPEGSGQDIKDKDICNYHYDKSETLFCATQLRWQDKEKLEELLLMVDNFFNDSLRNKEELGESNKKKRLVLFGADCLFFESYHNALAHLVLRVMSYFELKRQSSVSYTHTTETVNPSVDIEVLLMAPSRGGSLERFVEIFKKEAAKMSCIRNDYSERNNNSGNVDNGNLNHHNSTTFADIDILDKYDTETYNLHKDLLSLQYKQQQELEEGIDSDGDNDGMADAARNYVTDRHFPLLVRITPHRHMSI